MQTSPIMVIVSVGVGKAIGAWTQDKYRGLEGQHQNKVESVLLKITLFLCPVSRCNITLKDNITTL